MVVKAQLTTSNVGLLLLPLHRLLLLLLSWGVGFGFWGLGFGVRVLGTAKNAGAVSAAVAPAAASAADIG